MGMVIRKIIFFLGLAGILAAAVTVYAADEGIVLPKPKASLNSDIMKAFKERHSTRDFTQQGLTPDEIGTLLWAGYGTNRANGKRTVPSAHGDDLLDLYALTDNGVYRYDPRLHTLVFVSAGNIKGKIARQDFVAAAPLVIVLVGKTGASVDAAKLNLVHFTAGSAAENIYLAAGALNLGTVVIAWIHPDVLTKSLALKEGQVPLYIMPVGHTAER
jgi:nitroreductase